MATVNPTLEQIEEFARTAPDDAPIVMLNLLKFREVADYRAPGPKGVEAKAARDDLQTPITGRQAYSRYSKAAMPLLFEVGGQPLWMGKARASVIAPEGESWDEVLLVHYPSRAAFVRMVRSNAYQAVMHHRTAALSDSRLIETSAVRLPRLFLRAARSLVRVKSLVFPKMPR